MLRHWIMSTVTLLSLAGIIGVGCTAPVDDEMAEQEESSIDEAESAVCYRDGCSVAHQSCRCRNTGWWGYCGYGSHHPGCLYCRCD